MTYRYFYDCEFIEDGRTVDLVSIGVVDEHGREFYAVSTEFDDTRAVPWVRRNAPTCLSQRVTVPSVTDSPSAGIFTTVPLPDGADLGASASASASAGFSVDGSS